MYIHETIDLFKPPYYTDPGIIDLSSSSSPVGRPAFKYIFSYLENGIKWTYLQAGTIISGKVYYIFFSAPEQKFSQYLSVVQKLIDSFEIVTTDKQASPLTADKSVEFLTCQNSTLGLKMQYPSNSKLIDNTSDGISFELPDEVSESLYDILLYRLFRCHMLSQNPHSLIGISQYGCPR